MVCQAISQVGFYVSMYAGEVFRFYGSYIIYIDRGMIGATDEFTAGPLVYSKHPKQSIVDPKQGIAIDFFPYTKARSVRLSGLVL